MLFVYKSMIKIAPSPYLLGKKIILSIINERPQRFKGF